MSKSSQAKLLQYYLDDELRLIDFVLVNKH